MAGRLDKAAGSILGVDASSPSDADVESVYILLVCFQASQFLNKVALRFLKASLVAICFEILLYFSFFSGVDRYSFSLLLF